MKRIWLISLLFSAILSLCLQSSLNSAKEKYINIILFDVSGSMEGKGDGKGIVIFPGVKDVARQMVNNMEFDTYLLILPFGRGTQGNLFESFIRNDQDKSKTIEFINSLKAVEPETWLIRSYKKALDHFSSLKNKIDDFKERTLVISIFTDGLGNGPEDLPRHEGIENFIKTYNVGRTDYPHLYTRFLELGEIFSVAERQKLQKEGIEVKTISKNNLVEGKIYAVEVRPTRVIVYNTQNSFEMGFAFEEKAKGNKIKVKIESPDAENAGSSFEISPIEFQLSPSQKFYVSIVNKGNLEKYMKDKNSTSVNGTFSISSTNLDFNPKAKLEFVYALEPKRVKVEWQKEMIKNVGTVSFTFNSPTQEKIEAKVRENSIKFGDLTYKVIPEEFEIKGKSLVKFKIEPTTMEKFNETRTRIESSKKGELVFSFIAKSPNTFFEPEQIRVPIEITPDWLNRYKYYLMAAGLAILIIIGGFVFYKFRTARFPEGAHLESSDGRDFYLKPKFGKRSITIGRGKGIDVDCSSLEGEGEFAKITPNSLNLFIKKVNRDIQVLDPKGTPCAEVLDLDDGETFVIQDSKGNKIKFKYSII